MGCRCGGPSENASPTFEPVFIFDTTLRDGEQSPGASMNTEEKLEITRALVRLGRGAVGARGSPVRLATTAPGNGGRLREGGTEQGRPSESCAAAGQDPSQMLFGVLWQPVVHEPVAGHQRALIPEEKLRYCLDPLHDKGRDKARVFRSALGIDLEDAALLECMLREGISKHPAMQCGTFRDGTERWMVEWRVAGRLGPLRFISAWSVDETTRRPRLVSCYLKKVRA